MRRVVVTGMGAVTPIGNTTEEFITALFEGKNGIAPITYFDTSAFKVKLAAELKNFDPLVYMDKQSVNRTDPFVWYALGAASQASEDSGIVGTLRPDRLGVYFGSGIGGFSTLCSEHDNLREKGPRRVSPMFISKMIYDMLTFKLSEKSEEFCVDLGKSLVCTSVVHRPCSCLRMKNKDIYPFLPFAE